MIDETIEEVREMQTHSSLVIAVRATWALAGLTERDYATVEEFKHDLEHNIGALKRTNPSHASLYNALQGVLHNVQGETSDLDEARKLTLSIIDRMVEIVETGERHATQQATATIGGGQAFLARDYSSTAVGAVELAVADGTQLITYMTEARPRFLDRKFVCELTATDDVEPRLMADGASGIFLPGCDRVIVGMDCIVEETLYNHIGVFPLVAVANEVGVPVTVVSSGAEVVGGGFRFGNEIRSSSKAMLELIKDIELENPAYNATPVDLIDEVITGEGVIEF